MDGPSKVLPKAKQHNTQRPKRTQAVLKCSLLLLVIAYGHPGLALADLPGRLHLVDEAALPQPPAPEVLFLSDLLTLGEVFDPGLSVCPCLR